MQHYTGCQSSRHRHIDTAERRSVERRRFRSQRPEKQVHRLSTPADGGLNRGSRWQLGRGLRQPRTCPLSRPSGCWTAQTDARSSKCLLRAARSLRVTCRTPRGWRTAETTADRPETADRPADNVNIQTRSAIDRRRQNRRSWMWCSCR